MAEWQRRDSGLPLLFATSLWAQNRTTSGDFTVEPATLVSLGFEWRITGDDNRNAQVDVTFREEGEPEWRNGLPLMREQREQIGDPPPPAAPPDGGRETPSPAYPLFKYTAPNMFAGSILNLEPDTEYECRFVLSDPDGVTGATEKTVTVRTRKEPRRPRRPHLSRLSRRIRRGQGRSRPSPV